MKTINEELEFQQKVIKGLELTFTRLIEYKKQKKSPLVIMEGDKIVKINPEDLDNKYLKGK